MEYECQNDDESLLIFLQDDWNKQIKQNLKLLDFIVVLV